MTKTPSRILNEKPGFLGLTVVDFAVLGYFMIFSHGALTSLGLELLSFPLTGMLTVFLVGIRLKHRPKIIRDYSLFKISNRIYSRSSL